METSADSDSELLADWVEHRREPAFRALVARYATLVHMAAKRTCGGDDSLAAEASQLVFILLAKKAKFLTRHPTLAGWLHVTAVNKTRDLIDKARRESRKRQHLSAAMETHSSHSSSDVWKEMQPVLDDALAALSEKDREALLLRFYRSLTVREIAIALGIATEAAQKRIDRATERLRGKLARRGVQAGGSLSAAMVAGFTVDAQAAVPAISILASKAMAAGVVSSGVLSTSGLLVTVPFMKSTSLAVPIVALLLSGILLSGQRHSLAALTRQNTLLRDRFAHDEVPLKSSLAANTNEWVEWKAAALRFAELTRRNSTDPFFELSFQEQLASIGKEEIISGMDEIAGLGLSRESCERIQNQMTAALIDKDPAFALDRFIDGWDGKDARVSLISSPAIRKWAERDATKATVWLDTQISAGKFASDSLDGRSEPRIQFEAALASVLLAKDPDAVGRRLAALPPVSTKEAISDLAFMPLPEDSQRAWANLVRSHSSKEEAPGILVRQVFRRGPDAGYPSVTEYMDRIDASSAERQACVEQAAKMTFAKRTWSGEITAGDVDRLEEWANAQVQEETGRVIGIALAGSSFQTKPGNFSKAAELAIQYHEANGNDDVLVSFLTSETAADNREQAEVMVERIFDDKLRNKVLQKLQSNRGVSEIPVGPSN